MYHCLVKNKPSQVDHFSGKKVEGPFVLKRQLLKLVNAIVDLVVVGYWSRFYYMKTTKVLRILFVSLLDIFVSILSAQLDKWGLLLFPSKAFSFSLRPLRRAFCNTTSIYLRQYIPTLTENTLAEPRRCNSHDFQYLLFRHNRAVLWQTLKFSAHSF